MPSVRSTRTTRMAPRRWSERRRQISPDQYLDPREFCDDAFVVRQFLCPGCGVTLATELCKPDDPPVLDVKLAAHAQVTA